MKRITTASIIAIFILSLSSCAPEVGSEKWCKNMREKGRGEWTVNEAADFTKHCLF